MAWRWAGTDRLSPSPGPEEAQDWAGKEEREAKSGHCPCPPQQLGLFQHVEPLLERVEGSISGAVSPRAAILSHERFPVRRMGHAAMTGETSTRQGTGGGSDIGVDHSSLWCCRVWASGPCT